MDGRVARPYRDAGRSDLMDNLFALLSLVAGGLLAVQAGANAQRP
jgi:hypothetical protein